MLRPGNFRVGRIPDSPVKSRRFGATAKLAVSGAYVADRRRSLAPIHIAKFTKLNGLKPEAYINPDAYIAAVIDRFAPGHTIERLDELLPWNFKPDAEPVGVG